MNILFLSNHINVGGITNYCLFLGMALRKRGHNVFIASSLFPGEEGALRRFEQAGIKFIGIPIRTKSEADPRVLISLFKLLPEVRRRRIDILHANTRVTQVLAAGVGFFSGRPYVSTCHGFFIPRLTRRLFPFLGAKVIAISSQVQEHLFADFHVRRDRARLIPNGIDADFFSPCFRRSKDDAMARGRARVNLGIPTEGILVGTIGRLSDVKGHIHFVDAMPGILAGFAEARFLIVGEGKMKAEILARAAARGVADRLYILDSISDTREALCAMDVFVMPSVLEGLGLSLMEAMSCALPVVGSDVGGIPTLIKDKINGLLVRPADPAALAGAVNAFLSDKRMMSAFGSKAREYIAEEFSLEKMAARTEEVYRECQINGV